MPSPKAATLQIDPGLTITKEYQPSDFSSYQESGEQVVEGLVEMTDHPFPVSTFHCRVSVGKIGRASCRERV